MLPKTHIILGLMFSIILFFIFPNISYINLVLFFLATFLIDFDHYVDFVLKTRKLSLRKSFRYHEWLGRKERRERNEGIKRKGPFHIFHTIEFHTLVFLLGFLWTGFFYIFWGMFFHSLLDIFYLINLGILYRREFFLINWIKHLEIWDK